MRVVVWADPHDELEVETALPAELEGLGLEPLLDALWPGARSLLDVLGLDQVVVGLLASVGWLSWRCQKLAAQLPRFGCLGLGLPIAVLRTVATTDVRPLELTLMELLPLVLALVAPL